MKQKQLAKVVNPTLVSNNSCELISLNLKIGEVGKIRKFSDYMLEQKKLDLANSFSSLYIQNLPTELLDEDISHKELIEIVGELMGQIEDRELMFNKKDKETFYQILIKFGVKVKTEIARDLVAEYFQKYFPLSYLVGAVHQSDSYTQVYVNMLGLNIMGSKLQIDKHAYESLDISWVEMFAQHFGNHHLQRYEEKKHRTN